VLALALTTAFVLAGAIAQDTAEYVSNKQCKLCHNKKAQGEVWNKWQAMKHAQAFKTLLGDEAKAIAKERGLEKPPSEEPECLRCHVTAYNVKEKAFHEKLKKEDGVQCESCHGAASLHVADGKKSKMGKDKSVDMSAHISQPDAKMCTGCHNEDSGKYDPERYTLEDGTKTGFDFKQAWKKIAHGFPKEEGQE